MSTGIQTRDEIFPGYQLAERIGSGGYAEVWRARAPGGIDKAVKIVFGCYDDQLATQELKSLERIKGVRHPFVLSLERFEIVDGRLAILTELADMSLEQRAQQCRAQGLPGIPREELLGFIADTAEALDFLAERHSLQHLDIKPANLLISGDHIKVADFGLVKELASRTQNSMVAGMTPTYSSPEMFDDAPSANSDQYSLAIVYQEMLTGMLPFPGRTTAQLANQHLRAAPQLSSLIEAERPVVARALAKLADDRFPSCRAFVKALTEASTCSTSDAACRNVPGARPQFDAASENAKPPASTHHRLQGSIETKSDIKPGIAPPQEHIVDVAVPDVPAGAAASQRTLYVGIGGVGIKVLSRLRDLLAHQPDAAETAGAWETIAIDTDRDETKNASLPKWSHPLPAIDALHLPLKMPQVYREQGSNLEWLSHRWLYNIPRSLETRGYRALGRLALIDHFDRVVQLIDRKLESLVGDGDREPGSEPNSVRVVLIAGMSGGTGSGMAIDLANAIRARIEVAEARPEVQAVFVCTCLENPLAAPLAIANTYALIKELQYVSVFGNQGHRATSASLQQLEAARRPFDSVYVAKAVTNPEQPSEDGLSLVAKHLALAETSDLRPLVERCRADATPQELANPEAFSLRTFGCAPLVGPKGTRIGLLTKCLSRAIARHWLEDSPASEWRRLERACEAVAFQRAGSAQNAETGAAQPVESKVQHWRSCFGKFGSTRFAQEVVSRVCLSDSESHTGLSFADPATFVEAALKALTLVCKQAHDGKGGGDLPDEDQAAVENLVAANESLLPKLIDQIDQSGGNQLTPGDVDRTIATHCLTAVEDFLGVKSSEGNSAARADAEHALGKADVDLLQCGHDRRTLLVTPRQNIRTETLEAATQARPTAKIVIADVDVPLVFCEGSGIRPSSMARGLERVYPGIAEAARRLFTRIDIDWAN